MKFLIFTLLISFSASAVVGPSQFYGHRIVEERISSRMLKAGESFFLGSYLDGKEGSAVYPSLSDLLGGYKGVTTETSFRNGLPNSINTLLYYVAFSGLSRNCTRNGIAFNPDFDRILATMMTWPQAEAQSRIVMQEFWLRVMGYDAPSEEFEAWREFFLTSSYANKPANETVQAMLTAMMMNPYFLVRR